MKQLVLTAFILLVSFPAAADPLADSGSTPIARPVGPARPVVGIWGVGGGGSTGGGGSCPGTLSGSHGQISQCGSAFNQCENSCKSQQCQPMACSEMEVCSVDSMGVRSCHGAPCNVQSCAEQTQSCNTQCKSTYSSCIGQIDQGVEQSCGGPASPARCQDWSSDLSDHQCGQQKTKCEAQCSASAPASCRYNCIYARVKCRERLKSDLAVFCQQPAPVAANPAPTHPPVVYVPVDRAPASDGGPVYRIQ